MSNKLLKELKEHYGLKTHKSYNAIRALMLIENQLTNYLIDQHYRQIKGVGTRKKRQLAQSFVEENESYNDQSNLAKERGGNEGCFS